MFCTVAAQQAGERIVGTASHYDAYVLIECPKPWPTKAFTANVIPSALRRFIEETKARRSVQFLYIAGLRQAIATGTKVLIYEKEKRAAESHALPDDCEGFSRGYVGYEFDVDNIDQVVCCVEAHWQRKKRAEKGIQTNRIQTTDLLICTHGMRDVCCARFGQPFYRQAMRLAEAGKLTNTRIWQVSHIGGHRFAPTAISLPDGRYYGRLTVEALAAIASRQGSIEQIQSIYRGWGILPQPIQVLEQHLLLQQGWSWLDCAISYRCQTIKNKENAFQADLSVQQPDCNVQTYRAVIERDTSQPFRTQASCGSTVPTTFIKYTVTQCRLIKGSTNLHHRDTFASSEC